MVSGRPPIYWAGREQPAGRRGARLKTPLSLLARNHNNMRNREGFPLSKRKHAATTWVRIVVAAAVAGSAFAPTGSSFGAEKTPVKIGVTNASSDVAFHIGDDRGFFAEEGLAPEYIPFKSATDMVAPLATGQLDVGGGGASAALYNAAARGLELRIVADKGSMPAGYGYMLLVVRKDLVDSGKVKSFADLKGLKIGNSSSGGSGDALLNAALIKGGLKFSDVTRVYMSFPQLGVAFKNRAIDAAFLTEPNASEPVQAGDAVKFARGDEIYPDQALAVILYGPLLLKNRDIGQRFMNAYLKAVRVYNDALKGGRLAGEEGDYVIDMLVKNTNVKDRNILRNMVPQGPNPAGAVNIKSLGDDYTFYKSQGLIPKDIDPNSIVDNSFAEAASAKLGQYRQTTQ